METIVVPFFEYETKRILRTKSKTVGITFRVIQLCIVLYIFIYMIVWNKGYQDTDEAESVVLTKVKGVSFPEVADYRRIWDVADYMVPPEEVGAFFITTNVIFTKGQTQGTCEEDWTIPDARCDDNPNHCGYYRPIINGNGITAGFCVKPTRNSAPSYVRVCLIYAWCEVEINRPPLVNKPWLRGTEDLTVLIKNWIDFPKFRTKRRNIIDSVDDAQYLKTCRYNKSHEKDMFCPVFRVGTIIEEAGTDMSIAIDGGVIGIFIKWKCNLDCDISKCKPQYSFRRLDDPNVTIAKGYNFRYANYYNQSNKESRDLIKATGIRFVVRVDATAGKFSFVPLFVKIGSGIGLLGIATFLGEIIVLICLKGEEKEKYKKFKYKDLSDNYAYNSTTYLKPPDQEEV